MKITEIRYSRLANLGDFEHEKMEVVATVEADDDPETVFKQVRQFVMAHLRVKGFDAAREAVLRQAEIIDVEYDEVGEDHE